MSMMNQISNNTMTVLLKAAKAKGQNDILLQLRRTAKSYVLLAERQRRDLAAGQHGKLTREQAEAVAAMEAGKAIGALLALSLAGRTADSEADTLWAWEQAEHYGLTQMLTNSTDDLLELKDKVEARGGWNSHADSALHDAGHVTQGADHA